MMDMKKLLVGIVGGVFLFGLLIGLGGPTASYAQTEDNICTAGETRKAQARDRIQTAADLIGGQRQTFTGLADSQRANANAAVDRTADRYRELTNGQVDLLLASSPTAGQEEAA